MIQLDLDDALKIGLTGTLGTLAIFFGRLLDIDPFGNIHLSVFDFLIGAECAIPFVLMQLIVFRYERPMPPAMEKKENERDEIQRQQPFLATSTFDRRLSKRVRLM